MQIKITSYYYIPIRMAKVTGASLVDQWLRIHLPIQGLQVWCLMGELRSLTPQGN